MITKKEVKQYFENWSGGDISNKNKVLFAEMLQKKCIFARENNRKVIAGGDYRNGDELEIMLGIADDL